MKTYFLHQKKNQQKIELSKSDIIIEKNPDIILVSWCGKKFKKDRLLNRRGWGKINAVKNDNIYEISSDIILQPGPASLTEGVISFSILLRIGSTQDANLFSCYNNYIVIKLMKA